MWDDKTLIMYHILITSKQREEILVKDTYLTADKI